MSGTLNSASAQKLINKCQLLLFFKIIFSIIILIAMIGEQRAYKVTRSWKGSQRNDVQLGMEVKTEENQCVERHRGVRCCGVFLKEREEVLEEVNSIIKCHREFKDNEYRKRHLGLLIRKPQYYGLPVSPQSSYV